MRAVVERACARMRTRCRRLSCWQALSHVGSSIAMLAQLASTRVITAGPNHWLAVTRTHAFRMGLVGERAYHARLLLLAALKACRTCSINSHPD